MPPRMQQETKLLHSNITTKHMAVIYWRCLTKDEHWSMAKSHKSRFKQAWKKCKSYQHHRLGENTNMPGINTRKQFLEQDINMLHDQNIAKQGMAWIYSKHIKKSLTDHKPKRIIRYDGTHVNIASFVNRFRLSRKQSMAKTELWRPLCELDSLTTMHCMTR